MGEEPARASADWLTLRETADADARDRGLVEVVKPLLPQDTVTIHDLGCGTGSMARWLAPQLEGRQHWVLVDRDADLLPVAAANAPLMSANGAEVTVETRLRDLGSLAPQEIQDASLVTASALLDMMNADELHRFVATCASPGCPVLISLSVTGHAELDPPDPLDREVEAAFNAHQRRPVNGHHLLGPDAVDVAVGAFRSLGREVLVRPSPWRLGPAERELAAAWFEGWVGAAREQDPSLVTRTADYAEARRAQVDAGRLRVTLHHQDLLVRPR